MNKKFIKSFGYFMVFAVFLLNSGIVTIQFSGIRTASAEEQHQERHNTKVTICHYPPGNPENAHTITVSENSVDTHLAHGDTLGECPVVPTCGECFVNAQAAHDECIGAGGTDTECTIEIEPGLTECALTCEGTEEDKFGICAITASIQSSRSW